MPAEQADDKTIADKNSRLRRLVWIVGGVIFLTLVIFIIAQVWLVPNLIRKKFERGLSEFCDGPVEIENVEVDYSGQVHLEGIKFYDQAKRQWMLAERVQATFANWPSFKPVITEIEIDRLNVQIFFADGKFVLPLVRPSRQSSGANIRVDLNKLNIKEAVITVTDAQGSKGVYESLMLSAFRRDRNYEFLLKRLSSDKSEVFIAEGRVNIQDLDFDVSLQMKHQFTKAEMILPFAALKMPGVSAEGSFAADLTITGCFGKLVEIQPAGAIQLRNWIVEADGAAAWSSLNTDIEVKSSGIRLDNFSICDSNGVEWFSTNAVEIGLESWHKLKPIVTEIEVESPMVQVIFVDGKFSSPIWHPRSGAPRAEPVAPPSSAEPAEAHPPTPKAPVDTLSAFIHGQSPWLSAKAGKKFPDLQRLALQDLAIVVNKPDGMKIAFDKLWLDAVKQEDSYDISITQRTPNDSNAVSVKGTVNPKSLEVDLSLKVEDTIKRSETGLLFDLLNIPKLLAGGGISADLAVKGSVKKPIQLQPTGTIMLKDWILEAESREVLSRFSTAIEVSIRGVSLENLSVVDANGVEWFRTKSAQICFADWPALRPVPTEIDANGLRVQVSLSDGRLSIPIGLTGDELKGSVGNYIVPNKMMFRDAAIEVINKGSKTRFDNLFLEAVRRQETFDILAIRNVPEDSSSISIKGSVNSKTSEVKLWLEMEHAVKKSEMAVILSALNLAKFSANGRLKANLSITGNIKDPANLQPVGTVNLEDWNISINDKIFASNLVTSASVQNRRFDFGNFKGIACNGAVDGSLYIEAKQNQPIEFNGQFLAQKMSFVELTSLLGGPDRKAAKGSVTLNYSFTAKGGDLQSLSGDGQIFLDDADVTVFPILPYIFNAMGLAKLDPLKMSDAQCTFSMIGPIVKVKSAHIANPFGAIEVEPGGTINLQTGNVDMYVIAVPLRQLDILARRVPLADIVLNLKDKLSRFYVRGHWSSPPAKLITKTPIKDIKEGTVGFLQDVARNGGQFGQEMLKRFRALLPVKQSKND